MSTQNKKRIPAYLLIIVIVLTIYYVSQRRAESTVQQIESQEKSGTINIERKDGLKNILSDYSVPPALIKKNSQLSFSYLSIPIEAQGEPCERLADKIGKDLNEFLFENYGAEGNQFFPALDERVILDSITFLGFKERTYIQATLEYEPATKLYSVYGFSSLSSDLSDATPLANINQSQGIAAQDIPKFVSEFFGEKSDWRGRNMQLRYYDKNHDSHLSVEYVNGIPKRMQDKFMACESMTDTGNKIKAICACKN